MVAMVKGTQMQTIEERCNAVAQLNASFAHEGFELDEFMASLQRRYIDGELSLVQMRGEIAARWQNSHRPGV
jgi:hypothetical protein